MEKWQAYFIKRRSMNEKADWYAASISHTIAICMGGDKKSKISDHLLKFEEPSKPKPENGSKSVWLALFGIEESQ